jgi:hypothetical protein
MRIVGLIPFLLTGCFTPLNSLILDADQDGLVGAADCNDDKDYAGQTVTMFFDEDGDGFGSEVSTEACGPLRGYVANSDDCNDSDNATYPGAAEVWYDDIDQDCLGGNDFDQDGDGFDVDVDCDDTRDDVNPSATDTWYDGVDSDCDGASDFDADGDGIDAEEHGGTDCDDADPLVTVGSPTYVDCDGDGAYSDVSVLSCGMPATACNGAAPMAWTKTPPTSFDCDDDNSSQGTTSTWWADCDGDGDYGSETTTSCDPPLTVCDGSPPADYTNIFPNGFFDCDDEDDQASPLEFWWLDCDGDEVFASQPTEEATCHVPREGCDGDSPVDATSTDPGIYDCDDTNAGYDTVSDWYADCDGDSIAPESAEVSACTPADAEADTSTCAGNDNDDQPYTIWDAAPDTPDCDDTQSTYTAVADWYADCDDDGVTQGTADISACTDTDALADLSECGGPPGAVSLTPPTTADCDDDDDDYQVFGDWYVDCDDDGYLDIDVVSACGPSELCNPSEATQTDPGVYDCNDDSTSFQVGAYWFADCDGDGIAGETAGIYTCTEAEAEVDTSHCGGNDNGDLPYSVLSTAPAQPDCDDSDAAFQVENSYYFDCDGDGYLVPTENVCNPTVDEGDCFDGAAPDNYQLPAGPEDCDDTTAEYFDGTQTWYADCDEDGVYQGTADITACTMDDALADDTECAGNANGDAPYSVSTTEPTTGDCNDGDMDYFDPDLAWYVDCDNDGTVQGTADVTACTPADAMADSSECTGNNNSDQPYSVTTAPPETGDCDDADIVYADPDQTWFADCDNDGVAQGSADITACTQTIALADSTECSGNDNSDLPYAVSTSAPDTGDCDDDDIDYFDPDQSWYADCDGDAALQATADITACTDTDALANSAECSGNDNGDAPHEVSVTPPDTGDCDDDQALYSDPAATWYADCDGDGEFQATDDIVACTYLDALADTTECTGNDNGDAPYDVSAVAPITGDCDDTSDIYADADQTWYADCDDDGVTQGSADITACTDIDALTDTTVCGGNDNSNQPYDVSTSAPATADCDDTDIVYFDPDKTWYADCDNDGMPQGSADITACTQADALADTTECSGNDNSNLPYTVATLAPDTGDCDDTNITYFDPTQTWYADCDNDGITQETADIIACTQTDALADVTECSGNDNSNLPYIVATSPPSTGDCDDTDIVYSDPTQTWYADCDNDGVTKSTDDITACNETLALADTAECSGNANGDVPYLVSTSAPVTGDCDDTDIVYSDPTQTWYADCDDDGVTHSGANITACTDQDALVDIIDCAGNGNGDMPYLVSTSAPVTADCDDEDTTYSDPDQGWYADCDNDGVVQETADIAACTEADALADTTECSGNANSDLPYLVTTVAPVGGDCDDDDIGNSDPNQSWFSDCDNDGVYQGTAGINACSEADALADTTECDGNDNSDLPYAVTTSAPVTGDCDDSEITYSDPDQTWYADCDNDGVGQGSADIIACTNTDALADTTECSGNDNSNLPYNVSTLAPVTADCDDDNITYADPDQTWYADCDNDAVTQGTADIIACTDTDALNDTEDCSGNDNANLPYNVSALAPVTADCDDDDIDYSDPDQAWYADCDNDGVEQGSADIIACTQTLALADTTECSGNANGDLPYDVTTSAPVTGDCDDNDIVYSDPTQTWYADCDNDGVEQGSADITACTETLALANTTECSGNDNSDLPYDVTTSAPDTGDCDDDDIVYFDPTQTWYADCDNDGVTQGSANITACTDLDALADTVDCDGNDNADLPYNVSTSAPATEDCDDGNITYSDPDQTWYADCDNDGATQGTDDITACTNTQALADTTDCSGNDNSDMPYNVSTSAPGVADCDDDDIDYEVIQTWWLDCDDDGVHDVVSADTCAPSCNAVDAVTDDPLVYDCHDDVALDLYCQDCEDILGADATAADGLWFIDGDGTADVSGNPYFQVQCDMDNGGWIVLTYDDGSTDTDGNEKLFVSSWQTGNRFNKCSGDQAAPFVDAGLAENSVTDDDVGSGLFVYDINYEDPSGAVAYAWDEEIEAIIGVVGEMWTDPGASGVPTNHMVAVVSDDDNNQHERDLTGGHEVYLCGFTGTCDQSTGFLLTPGESGDCNGSETSASWYQHSKGSETSAVAASGSPSAPWAPINAYGYGAPQMLPAQVALATRTGGGLAFGWEYDEIRVRAARYASCLDRWTDGETIDGVYPMDGDGVGGETAISLYCDMTGGGWTHIAEDGFEKADSAWHSGTDGTGSQVAVTTCDGEDLLGGYNVTGHGHNLSETFALHGISHTELSIDLDYWVIDSWDDEDAYVWVDGATEWTANYNNLSASSNLCGNGGRDDHGPIPVSETTSHSANSATILANSNLSSAPGDESFGVDNVVVKIK